MSDLLALADRVEKAGAGSRELDGLIFKAVYEKPGDVWTDSFGDCWHRQDPEDHCAFDLPPYFTTSLDAAMSLVPEGWGWCVGDVHGPNETPEGIGMAWAQIWARGERTVRIGSMGWDGIGRNHLNAVTPALALCAAALRALANRSAS